MKYDHKIERMPGFGWPEPYDRDEKQKRIWQVVMIERDEWGKPVKDIRVVRDNLTWDEAASVANRENQDLMKAEWGKKDNQ